MTQYDNTERELRDNGRSEAIDDRVEAYRDKADTARKEVKRKAKEARHEVREQSRNFIEVLDTKEEAVEDGAWTYRYGSDLHEMKGRAREIRKDIREASRKAEKKIESRSEHFRNGLERIENDLTYVASGNDASVGNRTSSMQPDGHYAAKDDCGTENDYTKRLELHTEATLARIDGEVTEAAEKMRAKLARFDRQE